MIFYPCNEFPQIFDKVGPFEDELMYCLQIAGLLFPKERTIKCCERFWMKYPIRTEVFFNLTKKLIVCLEKEPPETVL